MRTSSLVLPIAATLAGLCGQAADQPLTNANVESMLAGGLPESTIVMTIQKAAYFGLVDLDDSAGALLALKAKGAGEQVLNAVVWAEPFGDQLKEDRAEAQQAAQQKQQEEQAVPGLPENAGVYFKGPSGWVRMKSFFFWAPLYAGQAWMHGAHEYSVPIDKENLEVQIAGGMPVFYVRDPSPNEPWQILHATSYKKEPHQVRLTSDLRFDHKETIVGSEVHDVPLTHVAGNIFALHPGAQPGGAQAGPGEFVLCTTVQGGPGLELCHGFDVRP